MSFALTLAAIIGGLLLGIVVVSTSVEWGRAVLRAVRPHPKDSWSSVVCRVSTVSFQSKGPWVLTGMTLLFLLLPQEPWTRGLWVTVVSWAVFALVTLLVAITASVLYSAHVRRREGENSRKSRLGID